MIASSVIGKSNFKLGFLVNNLSEASYENNVLVFFFFPVQYNSLSIYFLFLRLWIFDFTMLLQFSKPEIINSLKNLNHSLTCFIAASHFVVIYCSGAQVQGVNICVDSRGMDSGEGWTSWLPTWVLPKSFPSRPPVWAQFPVLPCWTARTRLCARPPG